MRDRAKGGSHTFGPECRESSQFDDSAVNRQIDSAGRRFTGLGNDAAANDELGSIRQRWWLLRSFGSSDSTEALVPVVKPSNPRLHIGAAAKRRQTLAYPVTAAACSDRR